MTLHAKICGLNNADSIRNAIQCGADFIGLNFYEKSPRYVSVELARELVRTTPVDQTIVVALAVDADDVLLDAIIDAVSPDILQLHGAESIERVAEIRRSFGLPVMKAIPVADQEDIEIAKEFDQVVDWLLFDAKPTTSSEANLPGGNGIAFDWRLLEGQTWTHPWMLSGGLVAETVCEAARLTGAQFVDVSSGVESVRGQKDPGLVREFLQRVAQCDGTALEN